MLEYDVVVVGAGPAGTSAAREIAWRGYSVLLIDKRSEVGRPVQCAEYVPRLLAAEVPLPPSCVASTVAALRTYLPSGLSLLTRAPGYILHRALFDKHLAVEAIRAGADVSLRTTAVGRTDRGLVARIGTREQEIAVRIVVGADGPHSTVGRWIGQYNTEFVAAAQLELVLEGFPSKETLGNIRPRPAGSLSPAPTDDNSAETEVYFSPDFPGGYAWLFPKGRTANIGAGVGAGSVRAASAALDRFVESLLERRRIRKASAIARTSGFVPVGGLLKGWSENVLLAGDAAGCVHPLTGAGIHFAITSGRLAGEVAVDALRGGDLGLLAKYERRLRDAIGGPIDRGLTKRERLLEGWTDDISQLEKLVRDNWIAFDG